MHYVLALPGKKLFFALYEFVASKRFLTKAGRDSAMEWLVPYTKLDNEQLGILQSFKASPGQNLWITGYAGSGKSVLLIHLLMAIKEKNSRARVAVVGYTHALLDQLKTGIPFEFRANTEIFTPYQFERSSMVYDYVLVDEVQDLKHEFFIGLNNRRCNVVAAGDTNQSIYDNACPEDDIIDYLDLNIHRLNIIHRLSRNARTLAAPFCEDRAGFMSASMGSSVELKPKVVSAKSYDDELSWVATRSTDYAKKDYHTAILLPTHNDIKYFLRNLCTHYNVKSGFVRDMVPGEWPIHYYNEINMGLRNAGLPVRYLGNGAGTLKDRTDSKKVIIMTYHSAKGLDFQVTFLPFLTSERTMPAGNTPAETLFFVALTRAREQMFLSYNSSNPHKFLGMIDRSCLTAVTSAEERKSSSSKTDLF